MKRMKKISPVGPRLGLVELSIKQIDLRICTESAHTT